MALLRRPLGKTGIDVPELGWGGAGIVLYGGASDDQAFATMERALELGIDYWDTAPLYGRGRSETLIGRFLAENPTRTPPLVATKIGYLPDGFDYSFDAAMHGIEGSLQRLQTDHLPVVHLHDIEHDSLDHIMSRKGAFAAMARLKSEGVIGHIGVSGGPPDVLLAALETREFETLITHNRCNLIDNSATRTLLPRAAELGVGVINAAVFAGGILATGPIPGARVRYQPATAAELDRVHRMKVYFQQCGLELHLAALLFSLIRTDVTITLAGAASPGELEASAEVTDVERDELAAIFADWSAYEQDLAALAAQEDLPSNEG